MYIYLDVNEIFFLQIKCKNAIKKKYVDVKERQYQKNI